MYMPVRKNMLTNLEHESPDTRVNSRDARIGLGHCRLSLSIWFARLAATLPRQHCCRACWDTLAVIVGGVVDVVTMVVTIMLCSDGDVM